MTQHVTPAPPHHGTPPLQRHHWRGVSSPPLLASLLGGDSSLSESCGGLTVALCRSAPRCPNARSANKGASADQRPLRRTKNSQNAPRGVVAPRSNDRVPKTSQTHVASKKPPNSEAWMRALRDARRLRRLIRPAFVSRSVPSIFRHRDDHTFVSRKNHGRSADQSHSRVRAGLDPRTWRGQCQRAPRPQHY